MTSVHADWHEGWGECAPGCVEQQHAPCARVALSGARCRARWQFHNVRFRGCTTHLGRAEWCQTEPAEGGRSDEVSDFLPWEYCAPLSTVCRRGELPPGADPSAIAASPPPPPPVVRDTRSVERCQRVAAWGTKCYDTWHYKGQLQHQCTTVGSSSGREWCATDSRQHWDWCRPGCQSFGSECPRVAEGGARCLRSWVYHNTLFQGCTSEWAVYEWCVIDADEAKPWEARWAKCAPGCVEPLPPAHPPQPPPPGLGGGGGGGGTRGSESGGGVGGGGGVAGIVRGKSGGLGWLGLLLGLLCALCCLRLLRRYVLGVGGAQLLPAGGADAGSSGAEAASLAKPSGGARDTARRIRRSPARAEPPPYVAVDVSGEAGDAARAAGAGGAPLDSAASPRELHSPCLEGKASYQSARSEEGGHADGEGDAWPRPHFPASNELEARLARNAARRGADDAGAGDAGARAQRRERPGLRGQPRAAGGEPPTGAGAALL